MNSSEGLLGQNVAHSVEHIVGDLLDTADVLLIDGIIPDMREGLAQLYKLGHNISAHIFLAHFTPQKQNRLHTTFQAHSEVPVVRFSTQTTQQESYGFHFRIAPFFPVQP